MPRTRAKSKKDPNDPPSYRWTKLQQHDKVICYNYWRFSNTGGEHGWNPAFAGSVDHYRASAYIQSLGSSSWFRHRAKLMVTLAEVFLARNEAPPNPTTTAPPNPTTAAAAAAAAAAAPAAAASSSIPPRPQHNPDAFAPAATMNSPAGRRGTPSRPGTPAPSVPGSVGVPNEVDATTSTGDDENIGIIAPTSFGAHSAFDYATRRASRHILSRTLLHNAVTLDDLYFKWITPRRMQFDVAWPDFFLMAEQMAALTTDDQNNMIFPPEHALTMDMSLRNAQLVGEDGRVWDSGIFAFDQDMKEENPIVELIDVHVAERNIHVKCLQVYCQ